MVNYCNSPKCLNGKTAIITGGNAGIGYATVLEFAKRGCRVILACRNIEKGTKAKDEITKSTGNSNVLLKKLDLESFDSVRAFVKDVLETEERLDILVNNAGGIFPSQITPEGLELTMVVNHYSHFLLTNLLLDLLKKSAPSRIINLTSSMARYAWYLKIEDLNKPAGQFKVYGRSKICNIYFTQELAKRLQLTGVTCYSVHPGAVHTEAQGKVSKFSDAWASLFFMKANEGAQTTIYAALEDGIEDDSGGHFENCAKVGPYFNAKDPEMGHKLWVHSEEMVKLNN